MGRKSVKAPRQKEIVKAFYKLAKKEGLENASIAKTAKLIDIQPSLIIHYFKSKEQLVYALVDYILEKYQLIYKVRKTSGESNLEVLISTINSLFSTKWNALFDDSVSYSCYALSFRNKVIRGKFKDLVDILRSELEELIRACVLDGSLKVKGVEEIVDMIYILVDGGYYYLSLADDKHEFEYRLDRYKKRAFRLLGIEN